VTPGILGAVYFREVAAILDAPAGGPPDYAALGEVMRRRTHVRRVNLHAVPRVARPLAVSSCQALAARPLPPTTKNTGSHHRLPCHAALSL
jgi:hypothetical protein